MHSKGCIWIEIFERGILYKITDSFNLISEDEFQIPISYFLIIFFSYYIGLNFK